jgi:phosphate-selective porin
VKLAYAYSTQKLTVQSEASYYTIENDENFTELNVSAYWKMKGLTLTGGSNLYLAKSGSFASLRFAPTACLPYNWQIGMQMVYYTKKAPIRELNGTPVYGCLSVSKPFGKRWYLGIDWHDMFDAFCSDALINRHAATIKLQYRF